jgi:hypothetical protein
MKKIMRKRMVKVVGAEKALMTASWVEDESWFSVRRNGRLFRRTLCRSGMLDRLNELFLIPDGVKKIWASVFTKKSAGRHRMRVIQEVGYPLLKFPESSISPEVENFSLDRWFKPFVGRTLYLQVEYEE